MRFLQTPLLVFHVISCVRLFLLCKLIRPQTSVNMRGHSYFRISGSSVNSESADSDAGEAFIEKATRRERVYWPPSLLLLLQALVLLCSISLAVFAHLRTPSDTECTKILSPYCGSHISHNIHSMNDPINVHVKV